MAGKTVQPVWRVEGGRLALREIQKGFLEKVTKLTPKGEDVWKAVEVTEGHLCYRALPVQ